MWNVMKKSLHRAFRRAGFEIVSIANLDAALERRETERLRVHLQKIDRLRTAACQIENLGTGTQEPRHFSEVRWVPSDQLTRAACNLMRQRVQSVLDIGCAFRPQPYVDAGVHICCEPYGEYMDRLIVETAKEGKYIYLSCEIERTTQVFPAASVDTVFLCDVIEHVDRDVAVHCLDALKRIARDQVVVFTPIGFMPQEPQQAGLDQWGMGGVDWQQHRSGWTPDDFPSDAGWAVVASKDYHRVDGYERPLEEPFGAMWAIWTRSVK